jgi:hypothetical protein
VAGVLYTSNTISNIDYLFFKYNADDETLKIYLMEGIYSCHYSEWNMIAVGQPGSNYDVFAYRGCVGAKDPGHEQTEYFISIWSGDTYHGRYYFRGIDIDGVDSSTYIWYLSAIASGVDSNRQVIVWAG